MTPTLLAIDTLDDRREVWHLLHRLSPRDRVRFLARCCRRMTDAKGYGPRVSLWRMRGRIDASYRCGKADDGLTNEVYGDLLMLACEPWHLDLLAAAAELEQIARGRLTLSDPCPSPPPAASPCAPGSAPARTPCSTAPARPAGCRPG